MSFWNAVIHLIACLPIQPSMAMSPPSDAGPELLRHDFVVRTRPAFRGELATSAAESPQRQAIVRALRALTGKHFGDRAAE